MSSHKRLRLKTGDFVLVDKADYNLVCDKHWCILKSGGGMNKKKYAVTYINGNDKIKMEHLILGHSSNRKTVVDHINNNSLDNRRSNLRIVTYKANTVYAKRGIKKFSGVRKQHHRYQCYLTVNHMFMHAGMFGTEEEAAFMYNLLALEIYGESYPMNWKDFSPEGY